MTAWGFGWRVTVMVWTVLTIALIALGGIAELFSSQYSDPAVTRFGGGLILGTLGAAILAPFILVLASLIGLVAGLVHGGRRLRARK